jgi:hypothetical protein
MVFLKLCFGLIAIFIGVFAGFITESSNTQSNIIPAQLSQTEVSCGEIVIWALPNVEKASSLHLYTDGKFDSNVTVIKIDTTTTITDLCVLSSDNNGSVWHKVKINGKGQIILGWINVKYFAMNS